MVGLAVVDTAVNRVTLGVDLKGCAGARRTWSRGRPITTRAACRARRRIASCVERRVLSDGRPGRAGAGPAHGRPRAGTFRGELPAGPAGAGDPVRDGVLYIYTQDTPFPKGERIYAPVRKTGQEAGNPISLPNWKTND